MFSLVLLINGSERERERSHNMVREHVSELSDAKSKDGRKWARVQRERACKGREVENRPTIGKLNIFHPAAIR